MKGVVGCKIFDVISGDFFDVEEDRVIWEVLKRYKDKMGKVISDWDVLYQVVMNEPGLVNRVKVLSRVEWLAGVDVKDEDVVRELLWNEFKEKEILKGLKGVERVLVKGMDVRVAEEELYRVVLRIRDNVFSRDGGKDVFDGVYERLVGVDRLYEGEDSLCVGLQSLDAVTCGGIRRGSLTVWLGATSVGKTMMLVWQSVVFMLQGKKVLFITLEDDEATIFNRFDRALFYCVRGSFSEVQRRVELLKEGGGVVEVLFKPRMTVNDLYEEYERRKGRVDVIVVDYGDLVEGSSRRVVEDWVEQGEVFEKMMGLARGEGIWVVTASQVGRQALSAKVLTLGHVGRSFRKVQVAQYVLALVQTKEEEEKGLMRIVLLKNKFGQRNHQVVVKVLREYCWFREEI